MDPIKEYWSQIAAVILVVLGFGKLRWDIENIKSKKLVEEAACKERQNSCVKINDVQFQAGDDRFGTLEKAVVRIEDRQERQHKELIDLILERTK